MSEREEWVEQLEEGDIVTPIGVYSYDFGKAVPGIRCVIEEINSHFSKTMITLSVKNHAFIDGVNQVDEPFRLAAENVDPIKQPDGARFPYRRDQLMGLREGDRVKASDSTPEYTTVDESRPCNVKVNGNWYSRLDGHSHLQRVKRRRQDSTLEVVDDDAEWKRGRLLYRLESTDDEELINEMYREFQEA